MRAAWWWIDRWRTSVAYMTMPLAEQGAYRNLIDELWLRDGLLPGNERFLAMASGAGSEWEKVRAGVMAHFYETPGGWRNKTHDEVMAESKRRSEKQARWRSRAGNAGGNKDGNVTSNVTPSLSLSPDLSLTPDQGQSQNQSMSGGPDHVDEIRLIWNEIAAPAGLPTCRVLNDKRKGIIRRALKDYPDPAFWRRVFTLIAADPYCRGQTGGAWKATFDYPFRSTAARWLDMAGAVEDTTPPVDDYVPPSVRRQRESDAAVLKALQGELDAGRALSDRDAERYARLTGTGVAS